MRDNIFFKDEDYQYYKKVLKEQAQIYDLEIISYCLMTNYAEQNPVKAFMVKHPWDYKYTSCLKRLNLVKEDILLSSHSLINSIENYKEFLEEDNKIDLIKEKTRTGKACGDEDFYNKIKEITGIDYTNKKAGRPKKN